MLAAVSRSSLVRIHPDLSGFAHHPQRGGATALTDSQTASDTLSDTGSIISLSDTFAGSVVNITKLAPLSGSHQQRVPVEPLWPNVRSEQPFPKPAGRTANPIPQGVLSPLLWSTIIDAAV